MLERILKHYDLKQTNSIISPFGTGLINHTWVVESATDKYILQRVNSNVFKKPEDISFNIERIGNFLSENHPDYLFVKPIKTIENNEFVNIPGEGYFRLFPFVKNSHTVDLVSNPSQAFEAARQFGRFTHLLTKFDAKTLKTTIPDFHNLPLRYRQFEQALSQGNHERIRESAATIALLKKHNDIVTMSENISAYPAFKQRVTHHDTKISNVLFNEEETGLCVIDLDTVMPGYFISDVGDMLRTYLSPVTEEEKDFSKIDIRDDYFYAIQDGYLSELKDELSDIEKNCFVYAGKFMIYMQALRFLTDYINNDIYYGAKYEGHNFIRANNQLNLLMKLTEKETALNAVKISI